MRETDSVAVGVTGRVEDDGGSQLVVQGSCVGTSRRVYGDIMLSFFVGSL